MPEDSSLEAAIAYPAIFLNSSGISSAGICTAGFEEGATPNG